MSQDTANTLRKYKEAFKKFGDDPKSLLWSTQKAASQRYEQIVKDINFAGKTILDIGCGTCDILPILESYATDFKYTGVDITSEFIDIASKKYPKYEFMTQDYFNLEQTKKYDVVICSGALNENMSEPMAFRKEAIKKMFDQASEALIFNMAGTYPPVKTKSTSNVWFANSLEVLEYCLTLTPKVVFRSNYNRREFTVAMFRSLPSANL